ncbi:MAG: bifunctional phosphoribosyl-AMP cyclohydrolase/phosphoribosyl-ATP diphosphatase HisIE [Gemmatimonadota bacterium]|nr:bifunctional phosphoribosyl-AMP cyclohydrolase/phosphoribosyl-ATP diphosphatase HisIE [Gemmatimonadota bacterium]MDH3422978.1 bifunctional phosphoribosyl-AMP cyclohydrolase/phosphoribosyl-ATP diphosphatase HisIE [Gemmatimonadota bacterium]
MTTDRRINLVHGAEEIDFGKSGLVPVVAQDSKSGVVLMVAWANREAIEKTMETRDVHFWCRSRGELWRKGETSGNTLSLVSLHLDCDGDALLARVRPSGPSCHTGEATCFGAGTMPEWGESDAFARLDRMLLSRAVERPSGSYTVRLLEDENLRLEKLGEGTAELVAVLAKKDSARSVEEGADLLYHTLVALRAQGIGIEQLRAALEDRAG